MRLNYKLLILPIIVLLGLIVMSFMFSSEIEKLKKQIDTVYFGDFIPVHRLHIIKTEYSNILYTKQSFEKSKNIILKHWNYYNSQYKTSQEREVVSKINKQVVKSFESKNSQMFEYMIKQIDLLIEYEVSSAASQRVKFLEKYENMKDYLFYNQLFIIIFIGIFIIITIIGIVKNHNRLEYLVNRYKSDSITDGLTGLYNRKYFDTILDETTEVSRQNHWQSAFVMIDIDFFKQYNDTYGHDAGDIALKTVAKVLDALFKEQYDYVFRLGGEEFGIIVFNIDQTTLERRLKMLQSAIATQKIKHKHSKTGFLTLSLGVVVIDKNIYSMSRTDIYKLADRKLYQSKENGRDQYTI